MPNFVTEQIDPTASEPSANNHCELSMHGNTSHWHLNLCMVAVPPHSSKEDGNHKRAVAAQDCQGNATIRSRVYEVILTEFWVCVCVFVRKKHVQCTDHRLICGVMSGNGAQWLMIRNMKKKILHTGGYYWYSTNLTLHDLHAFCRCFWRFSYFLCFAFFVAAMQGMRWQTASEFEQLKKPKSAER
ncbi:hypothetical protein ACMFMG_003330 [Clarireedia jacksonii]